MRIVSPYKPFAPEVHFDLPAVVDFSWARALTMLNASTEETLGLSITALTDHETPIPVEALRYQTVSTRLQRWLVEIRLAYLESAAFDQDTVLVSPDTLILGALDRPFLMGAELAILIREGPQTEPWKAILNSVQWWAYRAKAALVQFYRQALALTDDLVEGHQLWGGDTEVLRLLLTPIAAGRQQRADLIVQMLPYAKLFSSVTRGQIARLTARQPVSWPTQPIYDFRYTRKEHMSRVFEALFPRRAVCV